MPIYPVLKVTIAGPMSAGKTTIANMLASALHSVGIKRVIIGETNPQPTLHQEDRITTLKKRGLVVEINMLTTANPNKHLDRFLRTSDDSSKPRASRPRS